MIHNVPSAEDLETISLRLFFNAWSSVTAIVTEFNQIVGNPQEEELEWAVYAESAQNDLQGVYALVLQSQEIGIKSHLARVSPFLLLKKYDAKPITQGTTDYDFSDFPTIDAGELVRVHNMFCPAPLSPAFSDDFDKLRRARNKIAHLGMLNERLDPHELIGLLFKHYNALYPGRRWLPDRLKFISSERWAGYDGGSDWSPTGAVLNEFWDIQSDLTADQLKIVLGHDPSEQRHVCPRCGYLLEQHTMGSEPYGHDVPTAFADGDGHVECCLCLNAFSLREHICNDEDCAGTHVATDGEHEEICTVCGGAQS